MSGFISFNDYGDFRLDVNPITPTANITVADTPRGIDYVSPSGMSAVSNEMAGILGLGGRIPNEMNATTRFPIDIPSLYPYLIVAGLIGGVDFIIDKSISKALLIGGGAGTAAYALNLLKMPKV